MRPAYPDQLETRTESVAGHVAFLDLAALHDRLEADLVAAVRRVIRSNRLVLGPECSAFESEFASYCSASHAVGVGNGLDALSLGLRALGVGAGDEVIVPGHTFIATWLAVSAIGAVPVAVDVSLGSAQIDPAAVSAAITPRTAAIIAVHLYGAPAPMAELRAIAQRANLALIEDAAQAHGVEFDGVRVAALSDYAAFSFYPGKNLGALGDGGMGVTNRADVADRLRVLANYGARTKYQHEVIGTNSRLDEIQAAVLRVKLPLLDLWNSHRRQLAARYYSQLLGRADIELLDYPAGSRPVFHIFPIRVRDRDRVAGRLQSAGIEVGIHYPAAPHQSQAYADLEVRHELPHSARWAAEELSLPIGPTMSVDDVDVVVRALDAALPPSS
ncbi:MAG TPA: DegT/DnrJ/EryC1/StrS family aminotransferase [Jatrophihabitans sp.]|jgi:dTDP-3-amino-3,4,6-trideoxy-alpha-D-glucose transaminase